MKFRYLLLLFLGLLSPALAEDSATAVIDTPGFGPVIFTLNDTLCSEPKVLEHIPADYHKEFKNGSGIVMGEDRKLCWSETVSREPLEPGWQRRLKLNYGST